MLVGVCGGQTNRASRSHAALKVNLVNLHGLLEQGQCVWVWPEGQTLEINDDDVLCDVISEPLSTGLNVQHADLMKTKCSYRWLVE